MNANTFQVELEAITKSDKLFSDSRDDIICEIGRKMSTCLRVGRVNLWMFNDADQSIECIGNYSATSDSFNKGEILHMRNIPKYFERLKSDRVLSIEDIHTDEVSDELRAGYCDVHGVRALLDIPVHMEGKLVGVMCFEHLHEPRVWKESEVQFALAISQVVALAFETRLRRKIQFDLIEALKEKELMMREMHHRIKNNLNVAISLLRLQASETEDPKLDENLTQAQKRLFAMAKVHEQLYKTGNYLHVDLARYLSDLVREFREGTNGDVELRTQMTSQSQRVETSTAINIGLICTELLNNALKHAFSPNQVQKKITLKLEKRGADIVVTISDNGSGYDTNKRARKNSLGLSIVHDLVSQIDGELKIHSSDAGTYCEVRFR